MQHRTLHRGIATTILAAVLAALSGAACAEEAAPGSAAFEARLFDSPALASP